MSRARLPTDQILSLLAAAPGRIAAAADGLSPEQLRTAPAPGEWSANHILAHLRACADVWGDCIATILAEDHPTIRAMNPRTWMERMDYPQQEFRVSLQAYTVQREALVAVLASLPPEAWARAATVKGAGKPLERTVLGYADSLAVHERAHLKQMARVAAAMM